MKIKAEILMILTMILFAVSDSGANDRGLWVWSAADKIVEDYSYPDNESNLMWERFISFIEAPHGDTTKKVTDLYMAVYDSILYYPQRTRKFVADMQSRGYRIYVVLAAPEFAMPDKAADFQGKIKTIMYFQEKGAKNERFAGIMLDIEPHLLRRQNVYIPYDWNDPADFPVIWQTYMSDLKFAMEEIKKYNLIYDPDMKFSDAVAFWYDDPGDLNGDSIPEDLAEEMMSEFDNYDFAFYTIQSYRNYAQGEGGIIDISQDEMTKAQNHGIDCLLTVETMPIQDESLNPTVRELIGFENEGNTVMETEIAKVDTHFASSTAYSGMGIHSYADHSDGEVGYQDLEADSLNKAPAVIINYPNGVKSDGIAFTTSIDINVSAFIDPSIAVNYNLKLRWKKESEPDNDWHTIHEFTNVPYTTKSLTRQFDVSALSTTSADRIIIRADISYAGVAPADQTETSDFTDSGVAANETPVVPTEWSAASNANISGETLGLKIIPDNEGTLHAVYYSINDVAVGNPGIWYCKSTDNGSTWTSVNFTADRNIFVGGKVLSTWPRKHVFYKNGNFMAVAWVECAVQVSWREQEEIDTLSNDKIFMFMSNDNGQSWHGGGGSASPSEVSVNDVVSVLPDFPEVFVDFTGNVYFTWREIRKEYDSEAGGELWKTAIRYRKYSYNSSSSSWAPLSVETVKKYMYTSNREFERIALNTPAVCKTANGKIHVVWSEYKNFDTYYVYIKSKTKNSETDSWNTITEKNVSYITYSVNQRKGTNDFKCYPVYFPKLSYDNNMLYVVWQHTIMGSLGINDLLPLQSQVWFARINTADAIPTWIKGNNSLPVTGSGNGYAPYMSIWKNGSQTVFQLVYSNNFTSFGSSFTGDLIYRESTDQGDTWSSPQYLVNGSGTADGVRIPYLNKSYSWYQAIHYYSYPFIVTESHGISVTNWYEGGTNVENPPKKYKIRNLLMLNTMDAPFADFNDNDGIKLKWNVPNTPYAPSGYYLYRMANNDTSSIIALNSGNPILALNYIDRTALADNTYYRYKIAYKVTGISSPVSIPSNAIKKGLYLPLEYFDTDSQGNLQSGVYIDNSDVNNYIKYADNDADNDSNQVYKIRYENPDNDSKFAIVRFKFPVTMDFLRYGSIDLKFKILSLEKVSGIAPRVELSLVEKTTEEYYPVGQAIYTELSNDGVWHDRHFFLDNIGGETEAKLDKDDIAQLNLAFVGKGKIVILIDEIKLNNIPFISLENSIIDATSTPVYNQGDVSGMVLNPATPVTLTFGNMLPPWTLRVYTLPEIKNNSDITFTVKKDGLVRYEHDNDYFFTDYTMPIKIWCKTYAPPGFFDKTTGIIVNAEYRALGYPPIENRYFFRGYDFNGDKQLGILLPDDGPFVEGNNPGEYPFDIDGDGFTQGDDFFNTSDGRTVISEEPSWLFVPLMKPESGNAHSSAVVMDPNDRETWRILADDIKGAGDHTLKLYFAAFVGIDQVQYDYDKYKAYGEYNGKIIIELINN